VKFTLGDGAGAHQKTIAQRALAVIDVGDDRKVTNLHAAPKRLILGTTIILGQLGRITKRRKKGV
jgi:hypothetical protein